MRTYPDLGIQIGEILLPRKGIDLKKWAVIACDQYTSEPEYWEQVAHLVGDSPSTFHMILPEVYLGTPEEQARIQSTQQTMRRYLNEGIFTSHNGLILVERHSSGRTRHGIMLALDLEKYDYSPGSQTLIRATEGTILDRLPPRMRIREGAPLELPHILVLIDDPHQTVIEPLVETREKFSLLYDTDLMFDSGHLTAWAVPPNSTYEERIISALQALANPETFHSRYGVGEDKGVLLFAMGDGNHSLATAKAIWEKIKHQVGMNHPARYALVEIENVHDHGLEFEPIHRVLFQCKENPVEALKKFFGDTVQITSVENAQLMMEQVKKSPGNLQTVGMITPEGYALLSFQRPTSNLPVGTLQGFLDVWLKAGGAEKIDYVHGDIVVRFGLQPGNVGFYLPAMSKHDLFKTVILDGVLPRKTFSMGEARDKRFYMEARRIA